MTTDTAMAAVTKTPADDVLELPDETAWLAERLKGVGASESAAILGVSPWATPLQIYAAKLGLADRAPETERMRWGRVLEPLVAARYVEETGREIRDPGRHTIRRSRKHPLLFATLDREIVGGQTPAPPLGALEIKTSGYVRHDEWDGEPPVHVVVQVQHQLAVTGWDWASVAVLIAGQRFLWCDVERNDRFIALLVERVEAFWARLERLEVPAPTAEDKETLARLYPRDTGETVVLPADAIEWDRRYREATEQLKKWETVRAEAEAMLRASIGAAAVGVIPDTGIEYTLKLVERGGYEVKPTSYRALRRKEKKA